MTLLAEGPAGALTTIAMIELEVKLLDVVNEGAAGGGMGAETRLHIQLELREQPGPKPPEYFARLKVGDEVWQPWQPAELAIGAPPVTAEPVE